VFGVFIGLSFGKNEKLEIAGKTIGFGNLIAKISMNEGSVLGDVLQKTVRNIINPTVTPVPTITPTPIEDKLFFLDLTKEITENGQATFTWSIEGLPKTINKTTIYYGTTSTPGKFGKDVDPQDTEYKNNVKDFLEGNYNVPMRFIGNTVIDIPGTYYARAYAYIKGENIWSDEKVFIVNKIPKHDIRIISYPEKVKKGENVTITWEILGPETTTGFTTIVISKVSKPGTLDETIVIPQTPYTIFIKDFTNGTFFVPYRFIGNGSISESGTYYFRALAFVNNKNIWSDEQTFTVE
jgi:hypothetical protein